MGQDEQTDDEVRQQLGFERLLAGVSARVVSASGETLAATVVDSLAAVVRFFGGDRGGILRVDADRNTAYVAHGWYHESLTQRVPETLNLAGAMPWAMQRVVRDRTPLVVNTLADLPAEAVRDRASYEAQGIKSNVLAPVVVGGAVRYVLTLGAIHHEVHWSLLYVPRLQLLGEIIANTLERHRSADALRVNEARLIMAARSAGAGLWDLSLETGNTWATPEAKALYGFPPDADVTLDAVLRVVHPDDAARVETILHRLSKEGGEVEDEYRVVLPDGGIRWLALRGAAIAGPEGSTRRIMGVSLDITDRRRREADRQANEARLQAAVDVASLGFFVLTDGRSVSHLDVRCQDLFGLPDDRLSGTDPIAFWRDHLHPDDHDVLVGYLDQLNQGSLDRAVAEYRYVHPKRGPVWLHQVGQVLERQPGGFARTTIGVVRDVTEAKQAADSLAKANADLQRLRDQLEHENVYLRQEATTLKGVGPVVAQSPAMRRVLLEIEKVAATDSTVLLLGETGTGKELLASTLHNLSHRRNRSMVRVNCAAIPATLIEAELFGREKGAYTGALSRQMGRFEMASGSTIFLDEIGDLPMDVQIKLLRVLQERQIERLGSPRPVDIDLRVIAATNRDLGRAVQEGRFREDLFYRLNVFPVSVPPLRERLEDLPLLVEALVRELAGRIGRHFESVSRASMETIRRYHWPGNVRELRNVIERAMILAPGPVLEIGTPGAVASAMAPTRAAAGMDREELLRTLEQCGWRIRGRRGAAERLGLKPTTVEYRMARLGIKRP